MKLQFDHIGLVVPNIGTHAEDLMRLLSFVQVSQVFDDHLLGVSVQFLKDSDGLLLELIAPLGEKSSVANTLKNSFRLSQMAYRCECIVAGAKHLRGNGILPLGNPAPAIAFNGAKVQFFWNRLGFIIELIEGNGDARLFSDHVDRSSMTV
jgi:methylmalonyl-CoA/ethylmalonyl-CoA epimerase